MFLPEYSQTAILNAAHFRRIVNPFTILSAVVQGVLEPGHIDEPYALDDAGGSGHSLTRCSPTAHLMRR